MGIEERMHLEAFLASLMARDQAKLTLRGYSSDLRAFALWCDQTNGRAPEPADVTPLDIRDYKSHLDAQGMRPSSINRRLTALRSYFRWAKETGHIDINPINGIRDKPQADQAPRWLDRRQARDLIKAAIRRIQLARLNGHDVQAAEAIRDMAILNLLLNAGPRVSELCALRLKDVTITERRGKLLIRSGKGGKWREVPLNLDARKALQAWLEVRPGTASDHLFVGRRGQPLGPRGVRYLVQRVGQQANPNDRAISPHTLRHTCAKNLIDTGTPLDQVALLLGHKGLDVTRRYTTPSERDLEKAVGRIAWTEDTS